MDHTVTYRFGRNDYIALLRGNRVQGLFGRFGRWGRYAFFGLIAVVLINVINILLWSFDTEVILIVSAIMFVIVCAVAPIGEFLGEQLLSLWMFPRLSVANKDITLNFNDDGIASKYGDVEARMPWRTIVHILETDDCLYLSVNRAEMVLVPHRALPSPGAVTELAHYIRLKVEAAAAGRAPTQEKRP
jgi:hypothetical protein